MAAAAVASFRPGPLDDESRHRGGSRTSADRHERLQCGDLLRHRTVK